MAYESLKKNTSSWSPAHQPARESPFAPRPYTPQPEQEQEATAQPEPYSREAYDLIASRMFPTPNPAVQKQATPQLQPQPSELESEKDEQEPEIKKAEKLSAPGNPEQPSNNNSNSSDEHTPIQPKLTIGTPGDKYEQEADAVAAKEMSMPNATESPIQRHSQSDRPSNRINRKPTQSLVQRHFAAKLQARRETQKSGQSTNQATPNLESTLASKKGSGSALDEQTRTFMEDRFGADFSSVRVHTDSTAIQMNRELGAQAFTHGSDIFYSAGKSPGQNELTAHELTHVIQQTGAVQPKFRDETETRQTQETTNEASVQTSIQKQVSENLSEQQTTEETIQAKKLPANTLENIEDNTKLQTDTKTTKQLQQEDSVIQPKLNPHFQVKQNKNIAKNATKITSQQLTIQAKQQSPQGQPQATQNSNTQAIPQPQPQPQATENQPTPQTAAPQAQTQQPAASFVGSGTSGQTPPSAASSANSQTAGVAAGVKKAGKTPTSSATASSSATITSPQQDPQFQSVITTAKGVATDQKQHEPAQAKAQAAQDAAQPPSNEVDSKAQANQVGEMEKAETPTFDAESFKTKLMQRIADMAPKNLDEADKFKNNNQLDSVKSDLSGQVKEEQKASKDPLEEKTKQAPDKSGIEAKQVIPLPTNEGGEKTPQDIGADKAAPKPKNQAEVEAPIQQDSQKLDQQMAEANITDEQLANSNEPQFQAALGAKKEAQTSAATAPQEYRKQEQDILTNAKATAVSTAQQMLQGMQQIKADKFNQVGAKQIDSKGKDEQARTKIANDINQIYDNTKSKVEQTLSNLDSQVLQIFDNGAAKAKKIFEDYVQRKMDAYKAERYGGLDGPVNWLRDLFLSLPDEVNAFYVEGRQLYINEMDKVINAVVAVVSQGLTAAKAEITKGKQEVQKYINQLPEDLKAVGQEAAADIQGKFDELEENVNAKQDELVDSLAQKYQENLQAVDSRIEEMKAANKGLLQKAMDLGTGVIETITQLKDQLMGALAGAAGAVMEILNNPVKFLNNLVQAVKQGFMNFVKNIGQYLQQGLIVWLTGTLGESGIQMPESFDLKGVFSLVTQILGFTYDFIRGRAVEKIGEEKVSYLEKGEETFKLLSSQGLVGIWHLIQDKIGDIKTMVIEGIKGFVISNIVQAGVQWVLSLLTPASAFVRACKMIIDVVRFFFERGAQIASLVGAITNSITAIASGSIGAAITAVEGALGRSLPVVLGFLASLLGLGGIAQKIQGIIQKVRQPVTKAVDWVINKVSKIAKKIGGKFAKSKLGGKVIGWKNAAQQKYQAGKQWVEKKKQSAQKLFDKKKQQLMNATEKQKQRFLNTKAGKALTRINDGLNKKLDALEKRKKAFDEKLEAAKEWPNKQLEKIQDKAAEIREKAKDKFKNRKTNEDNKNLTDEHVTEQDKSNHKVIGEKIKKKLKEKSAKKESFAEFYRRKKEECKTLEDLYQPQLKKGINLDIHIQPFSEDQKDGDIDVAIRIAPNDYYTTFELESEEDEARFSRLLYAALNAVGEKHHIGGRKSEFKNRDTDIRNIDASEKAQNEEQQALAENQQKKKQEIEKKSKGIHQEISKAQNAYATACQATIVPNNTFQVGSGKFFVETHDNNYIVPNEKGISSFEYKLHKGQILAEILKNEANDRSVSKKIAAVENRLNTMQRQADNLSNKGQAIPDKLKKNIETQEKELERLSKMSSNDSELDNLASATTVEDKRKQVKFIKDKLNDPDYKHIQNIKTNGGQVRIYLPNETVKLYDYHSNPISIDLAKQLYKDFPSSISDTKQLTVFLASLLAEPSRSSVAHITNMLLLNEKSELTEKSLKPTQLGEKKDGSPNVTNHSSTSLYAHTSMTQPGSDPAGTRTGGYIDDERLQQGDNEKATKVNVNVSNRDLAAIKHNPQLKENLLKYFSQHKSQEDATLIDNFKKEIENYLGL